MEREEKWDRIAFKSIENKENMTDKLEIKKCHIEDNKGKDSVDILILTLQREKGEAEKELEGTKDKLIILENKDLNDKTVSIVTIDKSNTEEEMIHIEEAIEDLIQWKVQEEGVLEKEEEDTKQIVGNKDTKDKIIKEFEDKGI